MYHDQAGGGVACIKGIGKGVSALGSEDDEGAHMKRAVIPAAAAVGVALVVVAAFGLGHHFASANSVTRAQAAAATAARTTAADSSAAVNGTPLVPCALTNSGFAVAGHPGGNSVPGQCTVTVVSTSGNGKIELHWPGGHGTRQVTTTYVLGPPAR